MGVGWGRDQGNTGETENMPCRLSALDGAKPRLSTKAAPSSFEVNGADRYHYVFLVLPKRRRIAHARYRQRKLLVYLSVISGRGQVRSGEVE